MDYKSIRKLEFDSLIFGYGCYRTLPELDGIASDINRLKETNDKFFVDAKLPVSNIDNQRLLASLGFLKICTQPTLIYENHTKPKKSNAVIAQENQLPDAIVDAHAKNFKYDRFHQDIRLENNDVDKLFAQWIKNSLSGNCMVCYVSSGFCTFKIRDDELCIDLLSVLDKGKGFGKQLIDGVINYSYLLNIKRVVVTTEMENQAAVNLYRQCGFEFHDFTNAYHYLSV